MNRIKLQITEQSPFADGQEFGKSGAFEKLVGKAHFAVDPDAFAQASVVDLGNSPRNDDGLVEFSADLCILKPIDASRGNGRLLFEFVNRGDKRALQFFNDAHPTNNPMKPEDAGNGFLMRRGYTVVWGGWEGDLLPGDGRLLLNAPVATNHGRSITGKVRTEFITEEPGRTSLPLSGHAAALSYPTVSLDPKQARFTKRRYSEDARIVIPSKDWCFARTEIGANVDGGEAQTALIVSDTHIHFPSGFQPGWIYELVYTGRDPLVLGLGHVAVRDLVSFLRYESADASGRPNPLAPVGALEKAYAWGRSQSGRCIRDFIYLGFNENESERKVFDGVFSHAAGAGRILMNHRFANIITAAGQQYEEHFNPTDRFPFSYAESPDHLTGKTDAILKRPASDPLVMHTQSATEYWQRRGSLVHTDSRGNDLAQPDGVRIYFWASSQHFADPNLTEPSRGVCQNYCNVVATSMFFRALLDALDRWATDGKVPPASRIPSRADGTLLTMDEWRERFPAIPGVAIPSGPNSLPLLDFGPDFETGVISQEPPKIIDAEGYVVLVPAVDEDGNDIAGLRAPMVLAPLGTYTGWNLRGRDMGQGAMHQFTGSYIPFAESLEERRATSDPRRSILERYGDAQGYVAAISAAARRLVDEGFLLEEDLEHVIRAANGWGRPSHNVSLDK